MLEVEYPKIANDKLTKNERIKIKLVGKVNENISNADRLVNDFKNSFPEYFQKTCKKPLAHEFVV